MGKRVRRPGKIILREEESIYIPPTSVRRKLNQQSQQDPSPPPPPPPPPQSSLFGRSKYITRQSPIGLRPRTRNEKAVPSEFSSSPERSLSAEKVDQPSPPIANVPTSVLPQTQESLSVHSRRVTRAYLAHCGTSRTPLRSPFRNIKSVPCVSSGSTPDRHVLAENVDQLGPSTAEVPTSNLPQPQEPLSSLQTFANSPVPSSRPPDQNVGGQNQKDKPSKLASSFNCTEIAAIVAKDCFDPNEAASKADPALVTVNGYRVKEEMAPLLRSIIAKYEDIGKECTFQSLEHRSYLMERVCEIYQSLEKTEPVLFTPMELKSMLQSVDDFELVRFNVRWLRQRLNEIKEAFQSSKDYLALKEALERNLIASQQKRKELDEMVAEQAKINEEVLNARAKIEIFDSRSLAEGLL